MQRGKSVRFTGCSVRDACQGTVTVTFDAALKQHGTTTPGGHCPCGSAHGRPSHVDSIQSGHTRPYTPTPEWNPQKRRGLRDEWRRMQALQGLAALWAPHAFPALPFSTILLFFEPRRPDCTSASTGILEADSLDGGTDASPDCFAVLLCFANALSRVSERSAGPVAAAQIMCVRVLPS